MGNHWFVLILSLSLSGTLTGLLLLALRPVTGKLFSKKWNYYIWLIVAVRLILPVHFETNLVNDAFSALGLNQTVKTAETAAETEAVPMENVSESVNEGEPTGADITGKEAADRIEELGQKAAEVSAGTDTQTAAKADAATNVQKNTVLNDSAARQSPFALHLLSLIWLFGMLLSFFLKVNDYRNFKSYIMADRRKVTDEKTVALLENVRRKLKVEEHISLYTNPLAASPAIIGIREPFVILPESGIDENQLPFVLHHELIHLKRKDLWYKWLFQLVICIHWFNPLLYLFGKKLNMDCELSCDERVVSVLGEQERKVYGNVLLDAAELKMKYKNNVLSTTLVEDKRNLKERLSGIIHYKKETPVLLLISLGIFAVVGIFAMIAGVSTGKENVRQRPDSPGFFQRLQKEAEEGLFAFNSWGIDSFLAASSFNKNGEAWQVFDDDEKLAGKDIADEWRAFIYTGNGERGTEAKGFSLNGSDTLLILYAKQDVEIEVETSFKEVSGRFKLIAAGPEGEVETISDSGKLRNTAITLKKGRNAIKVAGQGAKLKNLHIAYYGIEKADFDRIFYTEEMEYAYMILEDFTKGAEAASIDVKKLKEGLPYMEEEEVSRCLKKLIEAGVQLPADIWTSLLIYSDDVLSEGYIMEALDNGTMQPISAKVFEQIVVYLGVETREALLLNMDKETLTFALLKDVFPYLSDKTREKAVLYYLELGNTLTYSQFAELNGYLTEEAIEKIDNIGDLIK